MLTPTLGGLGAGLVLFWGFRFAGKYRSTNLLEVVVAGDGRLPFRVGMIRTISSLISISTGASIGREGGITQLSATAASKWGQLARWQPYRLRLLVACGAAAGMSAAYNAPITGAIFAAHIVLGNFSMNLFAPLLCSSVVAAMLSRSFFGVRLWYVAPNYEFTSIAQLPWFVVLGILAGVLGAVFLKLLRSSGEFFKKVERLPVRMAVGGLLVGVMALAFPEVWGNGYTIASGIVQSPPAEKVLIGDFSGQIAGHRHHRRVRRGGRGDYANVVSGGGAGELAGHGAASLGTGAGPSAGGDICAGGNGQRFCGDDPLALAGDGDDPGNLAQLFPHAGADARLRHFHPRLAPAPSQFRLHRAAAPAQPGGGKLAAGRGHRADHRRFDARAGAARARERDAAGNRRAVPGQLE